MKVYANVLAGQASFKEPVHEIYSEWFSFHSCDSLGEVRYFSQEAERSKKWSDKIISLIIDISDMELASAEAKVRPAPTHLRNKPLFSPFFTAVKRSDDALNEGLWPYVRLSLALDSAFMFLECFKTPQTAKGNVSFTCSSWIIGEVLEREFRKGEVWGQQLTAVLAH